ncbi:CASP-like protein [Forsythia ovata]|uniref:CASP-like protein n=1 Tax=Forsythia ovata TaxID=205694 RepID=A0ABD1X4F9_9LAMI
MRSLHHPMRSAADRLMRMNAGNERFVETGEELDKGDFSSEGKDDIVENVVHQYWSPYTSNELPTRVSAAVAFHSLLQLLINTSRVLRKSPVIPSRNHAWLVFAADQKLQDEHLHKIKKSAPQFIYHNNQMQ